MNSLPTNSPHLVLRGLAGCALVVACACPLWAQRSAERAKPFTSMSASAHSMRDSVVAMARAQVGVRYVRGGQNPARGFDCSGLVRYVMAALRVDLPRTARQQAATGFAVERDANRLRPGDLLTFGKGKGGVSHVGIYIGGGRYVHASSGAGRVIESDISRSSSSLVRAWRGVRRIVSGGSDTLSLGDS